jgi:hypothetical protein
MVFNCSLDTNCQFLLLAKYHQAPAAPAVKTTEKAPKKATEKKGKKVEPEKEEPLDPLAEKLRQQRFIVCIYFVYSV